MNVLAIDAIDSLIATSDGTVIATATTLSTISTCSRLLTATLTFRSTPDWDELPAMTLSHWS